jgi:hypothetical protein
MQQLIVRGVALLVLLAGAPIGHAEDAAFVDPGNRTHAQFVPRAEINEPSQGNLRLTSVLSAGGSPYPGTHFTVLREQPDAFGKMRSTVMAIAGPKAFADIDVTPDRYRVEARNGSVTVEREITVPASGQLATEIVLDAGEVRLHALLDGAGNTAEQAWFRILRSDIDSYGRPQLVQVASDGYAESARFVLPVGDYVAEARYGDALVREDFKVTAGTSRELDLLLNAGHVTLTATFDDQGLPAEGVAYNLYRRTGDPASPWVEAATSENAHSVTFVLPAGEYRASARLDFAQVETDVTVTAGEEQVLEMPLNAGEVFVYATLAGHDDALLDSWFGVTDASGQQNAMPVGLRGPDHLARFVMPAGEQHIVARNGESSGSRVVAVEPGSRQTVAVELDAGRVSMALTAGSPANEQPYTWFSIYRVERNVTGREQRERVYNAGYYASTDIVLPAGRYIAFARNQSYAGEKVFEIEPGIVKQIEISASR